MKLFLSCAVAACCLLPLVAPSGVAPLSLYGCLACSLALLAPFRGLFAAVFFLRLTVGTVASRALSLLSIFVQEGVLQVERVLLALLLRWFLCAFVSVLLRVYLPDCAWQAWNMACRHFRVAVRGSCFLFGGVLSLFCSAA